MTAKAFVVTSLAPLYRVLFKGKKMKHRVIFKECHTTTNDRAVWLALQDSKLLTKAQEYI